MSTSIAVIAHRGASGLTGEDNTLRSFARAIELHCDYVEFDVRRTRDALVCFHDSHAGSTPISELAHSDLRARAGLPVPTLGEVLAFCKGRIGLDVEIKEAGIDADVLASLRTVQDDTPLLVKSFDAAVVARLAEAAPGYPVGLLVGGTTAVPPGAALRAAMAACRRLRADFIAPHHSLLADRATLRAELEEMPSYPWTVNAEADMARLAGLPIKGLITDRPDLLLDIIRQRRRNSL